MSDSVARGAANPQTIREHLEAIRDERNRVHMGEPYAAYCESMRALTAHAVAALDLLDNAAVRWHGVEHGHVRLVPDPAPRGDAEPGYHKPPGVRLWDGQTEELE